MRPTCAAQVRCATGKLPRSGLVQSRLNRIRLSSDRGSQYTSSLFAAWAKAHDVRLSVGRTGSCHDNAVAESFFGTLKNEWFHGERLMDAETTKCLTIEFIESYYNRYRPHEAIGDRVPAEVMDEFLARFEAGMTYDSDIMMAA